MWKIGVAKSLTLRDVTTWLKSDKRHQLEYDCMENPREEDFQNAYFLQDLYRPTCMRVEGKGMELSRVVCRRPDH